MKIDKSIAIMILIALVAGGLGFFAGTKLQSKRLTKNFQNLRQMGGNLSNGQKTGNQNGFRGMANGEIISVDAKSITVKMQDGSSRIVLLTDSTQINKAQEGAKTDLKVGERISVFGASNADGSVTATNIQLNPIVPQVSPNPTAK